MMKNNWVVANKANCVDCATCALTGKCLDPELVFLSDDAADDALSCYDYVEKATHYTETPLGESLGKIDRVKEAPKLETLQDLTGRESGIVIYDGAEGIICNWVSIKGLPRLFATGLVGLRDEIPEVEGTHEALESLLDGVRLEIHAVFGDDEQIPSHGKVYRLPGDVMVITPDGWH